VFSVSGNTSQAFTASEGSFTDGRCPDGSDRRKVWFQLMADARKIRVDGIRFDVMAHEYSIEAESIRSWFNREVMHANEGEI
jgi:hypothetical protein